MEFKKYQHIERYGTDEVEGIDIGQCYVFPKIDGTNGSIWYDQQLGVCAGSRNRQLTLDSDNHDFYREVCTDVRYIDFFKGYPTLRLYGEWLVPHTLKTYRDGAWRKFYVFDVYDSDGVPLHYDVYSPILVDCGIDFIPPLLIVKNPSYERLVHCMENVNTYLIDEGKGVGEGIVIKNYTYTNKYGRRTWAKMVRNEFKDQHRINQPTEVGEKVSVEERIVGEFLSDAMIDKAYAKIVAEDGWSSKKIPQLFGRVYHDLVTEDVWNVCKKLKNPTINFKRLNQMVIYRIKQYKQEIF